MDVSDETKPVPYIEGTEEFPLEPLVVTAIRTVYDPEIQANIFDTGLIHDLNIDDEGVVKVLIALTTPSCPVTEETPSWVQMAIYTVDDVTKVEIELTRDPFWKPEFMTEKACLQIDFWQ